MHTLQEIKIKFSDYAGIYIIYIVILFHCLTEKVLWGMIGIELVK